MARRIGLRRAVIGLSAAVALLAAAEDVHARGCLVEVVTDLRRCVPVGEEISVALESPARTRLGKFRGIADGQLAIATGGPHSELIPPHDILSIRRARESSSRQMLAGLIGAATAFGLTAALQHAPSDGPVLMAIIAGPLVGAAFSRQPIVYQRPRAATPSRASSTAADTGSDFAASLSTLRPRLVIGDALRVQRTAGSHVTGRYVGIDNRVLRLATRNGTVGVAEDDLATIEREHRVSNARGAVVGAVLATLVGSGIAADPNREPRLSPARTTAVVVGSAATGAAIGALATRWFRHRELVLVRSTRP